MDTDAFVLFDLGVEVEQLQGHAQFGELGDYVGGADAEGVQCGVDCCVDCLVHRVGELVGLFGWVGVFIVVRVEVFGGAVYCGGAEVAPTEAEDVHYCLEHGVEVAVLFEVGAETGLFVFGAEFVELVAEEVETVVDEGRGDVGAAADEAGEVGGGGLSEVWGVARVEEDADAVRYEAVDSGWVGLGEVE